MAVGISGVFGFIGGAIGATPLGVGARGFFSGIGLGTAEAITGRLYEDFVVNAHTLDVFRMYLLEKYRFAY